MIIRCIANISTKNQKNFTSDKIVMKNRVNRLLNNRKMVKFMKQFIVLFIAIATAISSCTVNKNVGIDDDLKEVSKKEAFSIGMWDLIDFYIRDSTKSPTCAKNLILYIESMDEDSQLIYYQQYKYLKKNEKKLIFITEAEKQDLKELEVAVYIYYKKVKPNKEIFFYEKYIDTNDDLKEIKISKKEAFSIGMWMLIEFYTKNHKKSPTSANDLIIYIENMDEDSQLIYYNQYKYLKKHGKKLIFTTDTENLDSETFKIICVYYKKVIPSKGLFKVFVYEQEE